MTQGDDVTPGPALAGRLLSALGARQRLQRGRPVSPSGRSRSRSDGATTDAIALELIAWPSSPAATKQLTSTSNSITTDPDPSSCACGPLQTTTTASRHSYSPLGRLQSHRRANSLDSTTTDFSSSSSSSTSSSRSRWNIFAPFFDDFTASNHQTDHEADKRSKKAREVWREYW